MKQNTAVNSLALTEKGRIRRAMKYLCNKQTYLHAILLYTDVLLLLSFLFALRLLVHLQGTHAQESRRVNHASSPHTCVGENKSPDIRVFSLTRGLSTIYGLLLSH